MDQAWEIIFVQEVHDWYEQLKQSDESTLRLVDEALELLAEVGPALGRPLVDTIKGSTLPNLKELRPGSSGRSEIRLLFVLDPERQAIVLVAGDKSGNWTKWYRTNIPVAEHRFRQWLSGGYGEEL